MPGGADACDFHVCTTRPDICIHNVNTTFRLRPHLSLIFVRLGREATHFENRVFRRNYVFFDATTVALGA